jgi:hypothetical protein
VSRRFVEVQRFDIFGDGADKAFAGREAGDVNSLLRQTRASRTVPARPSRSRYIEQTSLDMRLHR